MDLVVFQFFSKTKVILLKKIVLSSGGETVVFLAFFKSNKKSPLNLFEFMHDPIQQPIPQQRNATSIKFIL